jgi:hypothetical protein
LLESSPAFAFAEKGVARRPIEPCACPLACPMLGGRVWRWHGAVHKASRYTGNRRDDGCLFMHAI